MTLIGEGKNMEVDLYGLMKFGQKVHMEELRQKGLIYMNHLSEFLKIEDYLLRGDKFESLSEIKKISNLEVYQDGRKIGYAESGKLSFWHNDLNGNIYSMYTLFTVENPGMLTIDNKCKEFGDSFVIITNVVEFLSRVKKGAEGQGFEVIYGPVDYVEIKTFYGDWSVFKKPLPYSYQKEFRFFIRAERLGPICLNIGSIEDISILMNSESLDKLRVEKM